ncbi:RNA polymerase sigma factor [Chitinimonas sp. BJYL2]|uniref:RNA polymerase sigma factor n=1 Tax=Chitinimonas sp. BJYL2 TaxID=2976696 RepID=UPI0022B5CD53|nr:sigma-70 family RNA polymerase sigma factor [Chitinimonas sp. BJYL2]
MSSLPTSDAELWRRLRDGDEAAFTQIYRRYRDPVYRYALMLTQGNGTAADATQEAFLLLMRQPERYDPQRGPLVAFLIGVARNHVRRGLAGMAADQPDEEGAERADADQHQPLARLLASETLDSLRDAIQRLPFAFREALVLCDLQEIPYVDAAAIIGCPVGTVRSRLSRARTQLTCLLAEMHGIRMETTS